MQCIEHFYVCLARERERGKPLRETSRIHQDGRVGLGRHRWLMVVV